MEMYRKILKNDQIKFFALVIKTNEEKSEKKNPAGQIDFES